MILFIGGCLTRCDFSMPIKHQQKLRNRAHQSFSLDFSLSDNPDDSRATIWKRGKVSIRVNPFAQLQLRSTPLYAIVMNRGSDISRRFALASQEKSILYFPGDQEEEEAIAFIATDDTDRLIHLSNQLHKHKGFPCGRIQYISGYPLTTNISQRFPAVYDPGLRLENFIKILSEIDSKNLFNTVDLISSKETRIHTQEESLQISRWVYSLLEEKIRDHPQMSIDYVTHDQRITSQRSVIIKLPGKIFPEQVVILGVHIDSLSNTPDDAPGADDNASGMAVLIEIINAVVSNQLTFSRSIEWHFYAAEELGLIGSRDIASQYRKNHRKVVAMMQFDMTGYSQNPKQKTIYFATNDTDRKLRQEMMQLLNTYLDGDSEEKELHGGTSDHKSWYDQGFPTVFPFEDPENYNPSIHTNKDTIENINNRELMMHFTQLGLVFIGHFAGITLDKTNLKQSLGRDLFFAIEEDQNGYILAVSTSLKMHHVVLCLIKEDIPFSCNNHLLTMKSTRQSETRKISQFFLSYEDFKNPLLVLGYNEQFLLKHRRYINFQSNSF